MSGGWRISTVAPPAQLTGSASSTAAVAARYGLTLERRGVRELARRLSRPLLILLTTCVIGVLGFHALSGGEFSLIDCVYMTSITLTTVGYGEVIAIQTHANREALIVFTIVLAWVGMGVTLYAISAVTTFLVESNLSEALRSRRMMKQISSLKGHVILCGLGRTGANVAEEFLQTRTPFVVIEGERAVIEEWREANPEHADRLLFVIGDAADETVLSHAGILKAAGLITALTSDAANMLVVVSAKYINHDIRVLSKVVDMQFAEKLRRAGADGVVSPSFIGGMRLASQMIRPTVVTLLDEMLHSEDGATRVTEYKVPAGSPLLHVKLRDAGILQRTGLLVIAARSAGGEYIYNPGPELTLEAGMVLVVIGGADAVAALRQMLDG